MPRIRFIGLDVHTDATTVAAAVLNWEERLVGPAANRMELIRKLVAKLGPVKRLKACYGAGPTGHAL